MSRLSSRVFWQTTAETALGYAAAGAVTALSVTNPSWHVVLVGVGVGAALGFSKSLSSLKVQPDNGTDSFNSQVVAKPATER